MADDFAGALAYPELLDLAYSMVTSLAVVVMLAYDCDFEDSVVFTTPRLYRPGPERRCLNAHVFIVWMIFASVHGFLACLPWNLPDMFSQGPEQVETDSFHMASFTTFTVMVIIVHLKMFVVAEQPMHPFGIIVILLEGITYV